MELFISEYQNVPGDSWENRHSGVLTFLRLAFAGNTR